MSIPLVSIIIPSYNSLKYLDDSISSALNQTYENIEVILIDDGSTDGTKDSFEKFETLGVKCIYQKNAGASTARNTGLDIAKGEYVQFLDADDVLHKEKIKKQIDKMQIEDADLSFTNWGYFNEDINEIEKVAIQNPYIENITSGQGLMISFGKDNWYVVTSAWLVSREIIKKAGYWNPNISNNDDGEFFSRILFWSNRIIFNNDVLVHYRNTPNSLSNFNNKEKIISGLLSWKLIKSLVETMNDSRVLVYPKRGFYVVFSSSDRKMFRRETKIVAKEYDNINEAYNSSKYMKLYFRFVKIFGLFYGDLIFNYLKGVKDLFKK